MLAGFVCLPIIVWSGFFSNHRNAKLDAGDIEEISSVVEEQICLLTISSEDQLLSDQLIAAVANGKPTNVEAFEFAIFVISVCWSFGYFSIQLCFINQ